MDTTSSTISSSTSRSISIQKHFDRYDHAEKRKNHTCYGPKLITSQSHPLILKHIISVPCNEYVRKGSWYHCRFARREMGGRVRLFHAVCWFLDFNFRMEFTNVSWPQMDRRLCDDEHCGNRKWLRVYCNSSTGRSLKGIPLNLVVAADVYATMRGQTIQSPSPIFSGREICFEIMSPPSHVDPNKILGTW